jgi:hypothetical protein
VREACNDLPLVRLWLAAGFLVSDHPGDERQGECVSYGEGELLRDCIGLEQRYELDWMGHIWDYRVRPKPDKLAAISVASMRLAFTDPNMHSD